MFLFEMNNEFVLRTSLICRKKSNERTSTLLKRICLPSINVSNMIRLQGFLKEKN